VAARDRQAKVSAYIAEGGYASVADIVSEFGVSVSTARRDLDAMDRRGAVRRTRGGAIHVGIREGPLDYRERESENKTAKLQIGELAASLVEDGDAIILDGGTTTFQVARQLRNRPVQVITNSLPIAGLLGNYAEPEVVFLGGYLLPRTGLSLGSHAEDMLRSLHARLAIMGTAGATDEGLFNNHILVVELERLMKASAERVAVVADHTKFGRKSLAKLCELGEVDHVVSDAGLESRWVGLLRSLGVDVHLAGQDGGGAGATT